MQEQAKWYDDLPVQCQMPVLADVMINEGPPMTFEWQGGDIIGISVDAIVELGARGILKRNGRRLTFGPFTVEAFAINHSSWPVTVLARRVSEGTR